MKAWRACRHALVAGTLAMLAATPGLATEPGTGPRVLDVQRWPISAETDGAALRETSGLAWDAGRDLLVAATDRGRILVLQLSSGRRQGEPLRAVVQAARRVVADPGVNAESVAVDGAQLWLADERRRQLLAVDRDGQVRQQRPWPGRLGAPDATDRSNSGVEALVLHPVHGLLAMLQRPPRGAPPGEIEVHGDAVHWRLPGPAGGSGSVKAADLQGERLRLLLKWRRDADGSATPWLAEIDLASCTPGSTCAARHWPLADPRLEGHNLEGLACIDDRLCLLASDSGRRELGADTLLVLLAWPQP